jgi:hypothetical protein
LLVSIADPPRATLAWTARPGASQLADVASTIVQYLGEAPLSPEGVSLLRGLAHTLLFAFATRAAAVFMLVTAAIGARSGVFPRWFALVGFLLGIALLVAVSSFDWVILILPAWVAIVSLFILRRERARR